MKIFYCCYGGSHSSVVAAAVHLGLIPDTRPPTFGELVNLPYYDKVGNDDVGTARHMGRDECGNDVYVLGLGPSRRIALKAMRSVLEILGMGQNDVLLVDALGPIGPLTRIGGFLSRRLGLVRIGRPLTVIGIRSVFKDVVRIVHGVKAAAAGFD